MENNNEIEVFWGIFKAKFINSGSLQNYLKRMKKDIEKIKKKKLKKEKVKKIQKKLIYIVENHPLMSSKFEDIIKIENKEEEKIKSEALIGNDILKDKIIKENLIGSRQELIEIITSHKYLKKVGIYLTLKHIETAIYINKGHIKNKLSINISEEEITNDKFFITLRDYKKQLKKECNIELSSILQFEILEYDINFKKKYIWNKLKRLKTLGIDLSIDDFGSNFSNLKRVKRIIKNQKKSNYHIEEYIRTIKIDKKITSSLAYQKYKEFLKNKKYSKHSQLYHNFILHVSNIIEVPFKEIENILIEEKDKDILDILYEIERNMNISVKEQVEKQIKDFYELLQFLKEKKLLRKINLVFEFIDNNIVKEEINKMSQEIGVEILLQGYYFKETISPIFHKDTKNYIKTIMKKN